MDGCRSAVLWMLCSFSVRWKLIGEETRQRQMLAALEREAGRVRFWCWLWHGMASLT